jgi:FkbM family methyltransferase
METDNSCSRLSGTVVSSQIKKRAIVFFVVNPKDAIEQFHYQGRFYEEEELELISRFFRGGLFVDIGAHVGDHAIYVSKFLSPKRVIVFEPNPDALVQLRINLALNECERIDTRYLGLALADSERRLSCRTPEADNMGHTICFDAPDGKILSITGDSVLSTEPVEFIKLDVEGMEFEVLAGLSQTLFRWRPTLFVEIWNERKSKFDAWLDTHFYRVVETYERFAGIVNYLCQPV